MKLLPTVCTVLFASLSFVACSSDNGNATDPAASPAGSGAPKADNGDGGSGPETDSGTLGDPGHPGNPGTPGTDAGNENDGEATGSDATSGPAKLKTVFTILMENHDYNEIVNSPNAPFFNSLIATYGLATNYQDSGTHPSLPNYLTMISGNTQYPGGVDLNPTATPFPVTAENLGSQLQAGNVTWRAYEESMSTPCKLSASGSYAPKHDPFLYFTDIQKGANGLCAQTSVDYSSFATDLAAGTYRYMWITPNLTDDGHDPATSPVSALQASDAWAKTEIGKIMASPAYLNGGVIFLTWDEGEGRNGNSKDQVPMIIISPRIKSPGFKSGKAYSHKSYLATVEDILGLPRLATVATEPNMMEFFQ